MNKEILTTLENEALGMLLAGNTPELEILRQQIAGAAVSKREFTEVGYFTYFDVPSNVPRLEKRERIVISDIEAEIQGLQCGAGVMLFIDGGALNFLEVVSSAGPWPGKFEGFTLTYLEEKPRGSGRLFPSLNRDLGFALKSF